MIDNRPKLLIVSFSDVENDARVKKQISLFAERYRVTTCGFGSATREDVEHIQLVTRKLKSTAIAQAICLRTGRKRLAFALESDVRAARRQLRRRRFDVAIANDVESVVVAAETAGYHRTLADLHEYWPGLHDQNPAWLRLRQPYYQWMIRSFAARAAAATTVSQTIADRYRNEFGILCGVVPNATPRQDLDPAPVELPIRLVHSGGAQPNRRIEVMMEAVAASSADVVLDLFLTQEDSPYAAQLRDLAEKLGDRITIQPPVKQAELVRKLNEYDVGIHVLPPTNTNNALALPNKFFDFVQARLGIIIGPSEDMVRTLKRYELGAVADGFDVDSVTRVLESLTRETVERWKRNANASAHALSADEQQADWEKAVGMLADETTRS